MIKKAFLIIWVSVPFYTLAQQKQVSQERMQQVYNEIKTPYKFGLVMAPADNSKKYDSPSIFKKGKNWFMTYIVFDGRGYETWLAKSDNLLDWKTLGRIMTFSDTAEWDNNQKAGYIALQDEQWGGSYEWNAYNNKYWMSYIGGTDRGYESGALAIGIADTKTDPSVPHEWDRIKKPVLTPTDTDTRWWENKRLFKSTVIWDKQKTTGYPFVMYYNANGDSILNDTSLAQHIERIGMAVSNDMQKWKRFGKNSVLQHSLGITGDAMIQKIKNLWVMFYFGAFWQGRNDAFNRFACSYDLVHWTDWNGEDLIRPSESFDERYAHKSFVVKNNGVVYHFYCAVNNKDQRGIAVATSVDKGKSKVHFPEN